MSDAPPDGPDARRALLAVLCVLGLVAASVAAPALAGEAPLGGLDSPKAPSDVPSFLRHFDGLRDALGGDSPNTGGSGENLFGALSPGSSTDVGGPVSQRAQQQSSTVHFIGTSNQPTYWRTAAYERYTGSGWEQADVVPLRDPGTTANADQIEWRKVVLRKPARALPAPWKPVDFRYRCGQNISCDTTFELLESGGLRADEPVESGATYRVKSVDTTPDPSVLRQTRVRGSEVDSEYTSVETTDRVRELADDVVGDASNRYEAAKNVENYLESEKTYSLENVPEPGDQIADQFLFEQEYGYCEYYATTMVVMLRSQGIPARYVVGYAEGEHVGQNRYLVRGADAHAWVEVYFEDVGWVRFDPTPAAPRSAADDRLASDSPTYQISLNETATPGEDVTATVKAGGLPAPNVAVTVNGERVGVTNTAGNVTFTVPYAETLEIKAEPAENTITVEVGDGNASAMPDGHLAYAVPPPTLSPPQDSAPGQSATRIQPGDESNGTTREFGVRADVTFAFDGPVEPGETVALQVRLNGDPFRNASVSIAGAEQGRTDANGQIQVDIPADASGVVELTATRENLSETTTYPIDDLTVTVSPSLTAPLPWTKATVRVTSSGEAVEDAAVTLNGKRVGYTDSEGKVTFELPLSRVPSVTARASGKQAVTHVGWVLPTFALAVALALGALGGVALFARRRGVTLDRIVTVARTVAREGVSRAVQALVATADAIDELAAEFREAAEDGWRGVLAWLATLPGRLSIPPIGAWVAGAVAALRGALSAGTAETGVGPNGDEPPEADEFDRLQSVWKRFVDTVGVDRRETKTPGEVARSAVRKGFPRKPVYALTNAFRAAAYGGREQSSRLDRARSALASLRSEEDGEQ